MPARPITPDNSGVEIDERAIELIAQRVAEALRNELEAITTALAEHNRTQRPLTVGEVADRFGVARSTVYTHWREWGGYKLGTGNKASIRFAQQALPEHPPQQGAVSDSGAGRRSPGKRRRRSRELLRSRPRFQNDLDTDALTPDDPQHAMPRDAPKTGAS